MPRTAAIDLVTRYYAAFNAGDRPGMLALLADGIAHDINQGTRAVGKQAFADFLAHMDRCYAEQLADIVIMADEGGTRAAAEFIVHGRYIATDEGLPEATGQQYVLPAGAFFDIADGLIHRITVYYNLTAWTAMVEG